jgi:hypothetical protein
LTRSTEACPVKELEDFPWFPSLLRDMQTDFIGFVTARSGIYGPFIRYLNGQGLPPEAVTDLCSGSGEPAVYVSGKVPAFISLTLTDRYPPSRPSGARNTVQSADARTISIRRGGYYTMYNALHHFTDPEKKAMLSRIAGSGARAWCVEILEPTAFSLLKVVVVSTAGCLLLTPFVRPFSFTRLFFTYIFPLSILLILWDGVVSVFRSRSTGQYRRLFSDMPSVRVFRLKNCCQPLVIVETNPQ